MSFESGSNSSLWPEVKETEFEALSKKISRLRRDARYCRAQAESGDPVVKQDWLKFAANCDRKAEQAEKKLKG